jgi:two-component system sensor histidine kinase UhpB
MRHLRFALPLLLLQALSFATFAQNAADDSLINVVKQNKRDRPEVLALNALAFNYTRTDLPKAIAFNHESAAISLEAGLFKQLGEAYAGLVNNLRSVGQSDSALYFLGKLKDLALEHPDTRESYTHAAGLYYKSILDYRSAQPFLIETLKSAEADYKADSTVNKLTNLAGSNLNVGNNTSAMGDFAAAQRYHLEALRLFELAGNKKGISYSYQMIGNNYLQLHRSKEAREYTQKALTLKTELKDTRGIATSLLQLGSIFEQTQRYDSGVKYDLMALEIDHRLGLRIEEAALEQQIGTNYRSLHNDSAAERYYTLAKTLAVSNADSARSAAIDGDLLALRDKGQNAKPTEMQLIKTAAAQRKENDVNSLLITYVNLSEHYASAGQTEKSVKYMQKFYELQDSLTDVKTQVELHNMEGQYNVEKKEKEIALLKKDQQLSHANLEKQKAVLTAQNAILAKQKFFEYGTVLFLALLVLIGFLVINRYRIVHRARRAIELEKMRNLIARDLHDDIGSTLSSINIMSKVALQSPSADGPGNTLGKIRDRSAAIMEKMDDIVWAINPQNDTMEQLLYRMKEFAAEMLEPLNIDYHFEEAGELAAIKLDIRKRKDLYLVFKEAINNAAKYSQCSHLYIRLRQDEESLRLEITDDGKGFSAGTTRTGNGLNNMRERASSMLAKLSIESTVGQGTRIGLDLPIT